MSSENEARESRVRFHFLSVFPEYRWARPHTWAAAVAPAGAVQQVIFRPIFPPLRSFLLRLHSSDGVSSGTGAPLLFLSWRRHRGDKGGGASSHVTHPLLPEFPALPVVSPPPPSIKAKLIKAQLTQWGGGTIIVLHLLTIVNV